MFGWIFKFSPHPDGVWVWVRKEGARGRKPKGQGEGLSSPLSWSLWLSPSFILTSVPIRIANPRSAISQKELSVACYHSQSRTMQQEAHQSKDCLYKTSTPTENSVGVVLCQKTIIIKVEHLNIPPTPLKTFSVPTRHLYFRECISATALTFTFQKNATSLRYMY